MYRLAADIFNDTAMILDCLSPAFPKPLRVLVLSFSSILRALCGVAAGSSKATLSAHFAKWGNLGELNAVSELSRICVNSPSKLLPAAFLQMLMVYTERFEPGDYHLLDGHARK